MTRDQKTTASGTLLENLTFPEVGSVMERMERIQSQSITWIIETMRSFMKVQKNGLIAVQIGVPA